VGWSLETAEETITEHGLNNSSAKLLDAETLLVAMYGSIGKLGITTGQCATNQAIAFCKTATGINLQYLFYLLLAERSRLIDQGQGGTQQNISQTILKAHVVRIAPANEQQRIVSKLDELFSRIDEGERALGRVQKLVERYRQSVLKAAVTGELTRDWREKNKDKLDSGEALLARILKARREAWEKAELEKMKAKGIIPANDKWKQKYQDPVSPRIEGLPELPDSWVWASLDQITSKITSGSRDWKAFYGRGDSVFVMAQNVRPRRLDLSEVQLVDPPSGDRDAERSRIYQHDLLITIVGANTGDVCLVRERLAHHYVCQSVALARPAIAEISAFLELFLCANEGGQAEFAKVIYGAGRPHLSFDQLRATPIPLPPIAEQSVVRNSVDLIESEIDAISNGVGGSAKSASALRQSVLRLAFSGELVAQNNDDEPASALLARIAIELSEAPAKPKRGRKTKNQEPA
jgi:type I restriction enzyme, S subunit